ncbi:fibronectin type III domain-containing protein [Actinoplanes sp. NPDC049668]|uniref:fibronectin type III domain-containing protein n=1 Tax=unclassified Actinoplanes TaxID=2626549 RepID=UPI0033A98F16
MNRRSAFLCTAAALLPFVTGGCAPSPTAATGPDPAATARPSAQSWIVVAEGAGRPKASATPAARASSADPGAEAPSPAVSVPAATKTGARPGERQCVKAQPQGHIDVALVRPGRTTATVTWYHPGDRAVVAYRVAAVSQALVVGRQPELSWTVVEPGAGCHELTATVRGLQPATPYVFAVNATRIRHSQGSAYNVTVARSRAVVTAP